MQIRQTARTMTQVQGERERYRRRCRKWIELLRKLLCCTRESTPDLLGEHDSDENWMIGFETCLRAANNRSTARPFTLSSSAPSLAWWWLVPRCLSIDGCCASTGTLAGQQTAIIEAEFVFVEPCACSRLCNLRCSQNHWPLVR